MTARRRRPAGDSGGAARRATGAVMAALLAVGVAAAVRAPIRGPGAAPPVHGAWVRGIDAGREVSAHHRSEDTGSSGTTTVSARSAEDAPPRGDPPVPGSRFGWPLVARPAVVTPFRPPAHPYGPGHRGVDLAGLPGQPVLAAGAGTVVFAGPLAGRGVVSVQHDGGLRTTYEPLVPLVAVGAVVRGGDVLGRLGSGHAGCPLAACLHWGVIRDRDEYLDPVVLLRPAHVRLLPVPVPWPQEPA